MLKLHVQPVEALLTQPTAARRRTEMVMLTVWLDVDPVLLFVALFPDSTMLTAPAAGSALTADVMTGRSFRTGRPRNGRWRTRTGRPTSGRLVSIQRAGLAGVQGNRALRRDDRYGSPARTPGSGG